MHTSSVRTRSLRENTTIYMAMVGRRAVPQRRSTYRD